LGGVISPVIAGLLVERTGSFILAFAVSATVLALGAACYLVLVPKIELIAWKPRGNDE